MKKLIRIFLLFSITCVYAQIEPSVTFDPNSGNYIIEYEGYIGESEDPVIVHRIYEPTTKTDPFIVSDIISIPDSNYYKYYYTVNNSSTSEQRIRKVCISALSNIFGISQPTSAWRTGHYSFVPVFRWAHNIRNDGMNSPLNGIAPDSSVSGFSFTSYGLPTIGNSYFMGNSTIYLSFPDEPVAKSLPVEPSIMSIAVNRMVKLSLEEVVLSNSSYLIRPLI